MAPSNIKLIYFDIRGRAEIARLVLAYAGQKFEDYRFSTEAWPSEKPNTPFGQAPVLEVDGKRFGQSIAIATYLAREFGLHGKTNLDGLAIDQVVQLASDLVNVYVRALYEQDEARKAEYLKNLKEIEGPEFLGHFEKLLKENGTGFFVGNSLSLADIYVYDLVYELVKKQVIDSTGYPLVEGLARIVEGNENIKTYLAHRKDTIR